MCETHETYAMFDTWNGEATIYTICGLKIDDESISTLDVRFSDEDILTYITKVEVISCIACILSKFADGAANVA